MKKIWTVAIMTFVLSTFSALAMAAEDAYEIQWVAKCLMDNKDQGQRLEVVRKYCECMVEKMETSELQSVTQWEKTHPTEREQCSNTAGWK